LLILWIFLGSAILFFAQRAIYAHAWAKGVRLFLRFERSHAAAGEDVPVYEQVENRKWLPLPVFGYRYSLCRNFELLPKNGAFPERVSHRLALPAQKRVRAQTRLHGLARGIYTVTQAEIFGTDLFGTLKETRPAACTAMLTVRPARLPAAQLAAPFRQLFGAVLTRRSSLEDPFALRGIRPYESYDSMHSINWKASAKTGDWKVNQHAYTTDESVLFLLDLEHGTPDEQEELISLASSMSAMLLGRGVTVGLRSNARGCLTALPLAVRPGGGAGQQAAIDDALAQAKPGAAGSKGFDLWLCELNRSDLDRCLPVLLSVLAEQTTLRAYETLLCRDQGFFLTTHGRIRPSRQVAFLPWTGREGGKSA